MSTEMKNPQPDEPAATVGVTRSVEWTGILKAGVLAQRLVPGAICIGFRQLKRAQPVETQNVQTEAGPLTIPTLDEMICMKAFLAYDRNTTRDYLDFAALSECAAEDVVLRSLLKLDTRYGGLQTDSVGLEVAKALCAAAPF